MSFEVLREDRFHDYESLEIQGKEFRVPLPVDPPDIKLIERPEIMDRASAAWLRLDGLPPLHFRFYGPPGVGKNAIVYKLAESLKTDLYIINGHEELRAEDVACSITVTSKGKFVYVASPVFAAMMRGGILFFDEIGKAPHAALDPLASALDDRATLNSVQAGVHLKAHPNFRCCAALNEDEEHGIGLPGFLDERLRPAFYVGYPSSKTLEKILRSRLPMAADIWFKVFQQEFKNRQISCRVAVTVMGFAYRLAQQAGKTNLNEQDVAEYLIRARSETDSFDEEARTDAALESSSGGKDDDIWISYRTPGEDDDLIN